jgi:pimeloyl-ACP methyl ester carboxylesterase
MKKLLFVPIIIFSFCATPAAYAETHIAQDTVFEPGAIWTQDRSPYILDDDITIPRGETLQIGPGVAVTTSSSSPGSLFVQGSIIFEGTPEKPITVDNLTSFWISYSTSTISNAIIRIPTGLDILKSTVSISSSTITGADNGINARGSTVDIQNSVISGNNYGIYSQPMPKPIFLEFNSKFNPFGAMTVYAQTVDDPFENHISISSSSITGNSLYGVFNSTTNIVQAENNWWGNVAGPEGATSSAISGSVDYTPWLSKDPTIPAPIATACCSNVLFLPGIEASRLYLGNNQLWEPNRNADVQKLFMNSTGQSINSGIYTKDIMGSAFGLHAIYKSFIAMMNGVVADKTINSWQAYPYDWRFDVGTVVSSALLNAVQSLASTSKTGKVTIVAHSNGGLVAKLLAKTLSDKGESGLLDKVIMIAVPQLGTPQAVTGLLHGDGESILGGLLLKQSIARGLGENIPGAYGLLPSKAYFLANLSPANLLAPIISFATSTLADFNFSGDSQTVSTYDALRSFLSGSADHRSDPASGDTNLPAVLHTAMIDAAQKIHDSLDFFSFASTTKEIVLAGWGNATFAGLSYYEKISCSGNVFTRMLGATSTCTKLLERSATTTPFGDDTVVMGSADDGASTNILTTSSSSSSNISDYYFNLGSENKGKLIDDGHSTILNTDSGVAFVQDQITATSSALPPYISSTRPTWADVHNDDLTVSVHSPVELNMYDSEGRHTGPIPNPIPGSDLGAFETNIPGSIYMPNDGDTYITVPYGTDYKTTFSGTGMGSFEVDTEHNVNGVDVSGTTFADMPVTPLLQAQLILATTTQSNNSSTPATTTSMILFDFDGDGTVDATTTPHDAYDPALDMESMKAIVSTLNLSPFKEKIMRDKLNTIIDCLKKKKPIKQIAKPNVQAIAAAQQAIKDLQNQHWVFKNLDVTRKQKLEDIFQAFLDNIDIP